MRIDRAPFGQVRIPDRYDNGMVRLHTERFAVIGRETRRVTLDIAEYWAAAEDPGSREDLNAQGCFAIEPRWHVQVGAGTGAAGAERLNVVEHTDAIHPRVHRHPDGSPTQCERQRTCGRRSSGWCFVDSVLGGALEATTSSAIDVFRLRRGSLHDLDRILLRRWIDDFGTRRSLLPPIRPTARPFHDPDR